jgi:hypothetical protein
MTEIEAVVSDEKNVLVCCRVADIDPPVASTVECCGNCGKAVWRALSSPDTDMILCIQCGYAQIRAAKAAGKPVMFEGPTAEQLQEIKNHR